MHNITINDYSLIKYCTQIKTMVDLLDNIDSTIPDKNLITYTINGLSSKFDYIVSLICLRLSLPLFLDQIYVITRKSKE